MLTKAEPDASASEAQGRSEEWSVCGQVAHLSNGDGAALRRMYLTRSYRADGVVVTLLQRARVDLDPDDEVMFAGWCLLAHTAAVISGTTNRFAHADKRSFGRSLHLAGVKEMSVLRLVSARGPAIADQVRRVARVLARSGSDAIPTDLKALRELADPSEATAERARRRIVRDFYRASDLVGVQTRGDTE